jgi:ankyrin repeat protein
LQELRLALTVNNMNDADPNGWTALHWAANFGHVDCVKLCIKMGADMNVRVIDGWAPLTLASWTGHFDVVRLLLDAGAIIDATDNGIPLKYAIEHKDVDSIRLLIDRGEKVSNVKLDQLYAQAIPDWVNTFIESRSNCRNVSIIIIGIHKYRRTTVTGNDINVLRLVSKHIWSTRMDDVWVTPPVEGSESD